MGPGNPAVIPGGMSARDLETTRTRPPAPYVEGVYPRQVLTAGFTKARVRRRIE